MHLLLRTLLIYLAIIAFGVWVVYETKIHKTVDVLLDDPLIKGISIIIGAFHYIPFLRKKFIEKLYTIDFIEICVFYSTIIAFLSFYNTDFIKLMPFILLISCEFILVSLGDARIRNEFPRTNHYRAIAITIEIIRELNNVFIMCIILHTINNHKIIHPFHFAAFGYASTLEWKSCLTHSLFEIIVKIMEYKIGFNFPFGTMLIIIQFMIAYFIAFGNW